MPTDTKTDKARVDHTHEYVCGDLSVTLDSSGIHWADNKGFGPKYCHMPLSRARDLYEILACILKDNPNA